MDIFDSLICPLCHCYLNKVNNSLKCESNHSFDISSTGYVNLLKPGKKNNARAGDSKEMIKARTNFFECGAYKNICNKICSLAKELNPKVIIDAGCGEGYYTESLAKIDTSPTVFGVDMSKFGCEHGAKSAKKQMLNNLFYTVGSIFELPFKNESADLIVNMFAPVASDEFYRVLKPKGHFIVASAGINHLDGLKRVIYDKVYQNEEKILDYNGFELVRCENLKYETTVCGNQTIQNLFTMTPYYHRTSLEDKKKLDNVCEITTVVEVNFSIYQKI